MKTFLKILGGLFLAAALAAAGLLAWFFLFVCQGGHGMC